MVDGLKGLMRLVVGVLVVVVVLWLLRSTNIVAETLDLFAVQSGKLQVSAAPAASTALELGLSVLSAVAFVLTKIGTAAIAACEAMIGSVIGSGSDTTPSIIPKSEPNTLEALLPEYEKLTSQVQMLRLYEASKAKDPDGLAFAANQIAGTAWVEARGHVVQPAVSMAQGAVS